MTVPTEARRSRLEVRCRRHKSHTIAAWSTFDGRQVLVEFNDKSAEEYIGWMPDGATRDEVESGPLRGMLHFATAAPREGDVAHLRYRLACALPSCQPVLLRVDNIEKIHGEVLKMWEAGRPKLIIKDVLAYLRST